MPKRGIAIVCVVGAALLAAAEAAIVDGMPEMTDNSLEARGPVEAPRKAAGDGSVLDQFSVRYPDGSYEFRYELADGSARYERGYFVLVDDAPSLVVVGYYAYRSPDGRYITVFYNADRNGYRQNQSITHEVYPNLPRSIEVPATHQQPATGNRL